MMAHRKVPRRVFARAKEDAAVAKTATETPQTSHPAYKLAFQDSDFLLREDLRPVRFQLELLKPELLLDNRLEDYAETVNHDDAESAAGEGKQTTFEN